MKKELNLKLKIKSTTFNYSTKNNNYIKVKNYNL